MEKKTNTSERSSSKVVTTGYKLSEYGRQLKEKQKVKEIYGIRERQFRRFFDIASRGQEATGEALLSLLERRLDNVLYRAKLANTRTQARQIIVHGHILVNNKKVYSPSYLVKRLMSLPYITSYISIYKYICHNRNYFKSDLLHVNAYA